jgi:hypothetical protein
MSRLIEHEFEDHRCAECRVRDAVGPCAACESMICGECGVLTKDSVGTRCICLSCARLIADVGERRPRGQRPSATIQWVAIVVLVAFAVTMVAAL